MHPQRTHWAALWCSIFVFFSFFLSLCLGKLVNDIHSNQISAIADIVSRTYRNEMKAEHNWQLRLSWKKKGELRRSPYNEREEKRERYVVVEAHEIWGGDHLARMIWFHINSMLRSFHMWISFSNEIISQYECALSRAHTHTHARSHCQFYAINSFTLSFHITIVLCCICACWCIKLMLLLCVLAL